jgi:hypothetical protein
MTLGNGPILGNGNYPSLGTHSADGFRSGNIATESQMMLGGVITSNVEPNSYDHGANGVINSTRYTYIIRPRAEVFNVLTAGTPSLASAGYLPLSPTAGYGTYVTLNGVQVIRLDVPRCVVFAFSAPIPALGEITITVFGYDYGGYPIVEQINAIVGSNTFSSLNAFAYIRAAYFSAGTGALTVTMGVRNIFGIPFYFYDAGCLNVYYGGLPVTTATNAMVPGNTTYPATNSTGDARGTVYAIANNSNYLMVNMFVFGAQANEAIYNQANSLQLAPMIANPIVGGSPATISLFSNPFTARYGITPYSQPLI